MKITLNKQNRIWLILGVLALIILIAIIAASIINNSSSNTTPKIHIENWGEISEIPQNTRTIVEEKLYSRIKENSSSEVPTSGAKIRENSQYSIKQEPNFVTGDFIVDIPKIEQSYIIKYLYGQKEGQRNPEISASVDILCVTNPSEIIYPDFQCTNKNGFKDTDKYLGIYYFGLQLPHTETLANGKEFTIKIQTFDEKTTELVVSVNSCGDKTIMQEAENAAKKWVNSLNLNIGQITYFVPLEYNNCLVR